MNPMRLKCLPVWTAKEILTLLYLRQARTLTEAAELLAVPVEPLDPESLEPLDPEPLEPLDPDEDAEPPKNTVSTVELAVNRPIVTHWSLCCCRSFHCYQIHQIQNLKRLQNYQKQ